MSSSSPEPGRTPSPAFSTPSPSSGTPTATWSPRTSSSSPRTCSGPCCPAASTKSTSPLPTFAAATTSPFSVWTASILSLVGALVAALDTPLSLCGSRMASTYARVPTLRVFPSSSTGLLPTVSSARLTTNGSSKPWRPTTTWPGSLWTSSTATVSTSLPLVRSSRALRALLTDGTTLCSRSSTRRRTTFLAPLPQICSRT
mmetsp:Transcript_12402/g.49705  ORF Transcript_12402/g.49705 Transcript_12402/m.49705 type:complete len:201 (+) Transcript_12402:659-1261(+)